MCVCDWGITRYRIANKEIHKVAVDYMLYELTVGWCQGYMFVVDSLALVPFFEQQGDVGSRNLTLIMWGLKCEDLRSGNRCCHFFQKS